MAKPGTVRNCSSSVWKRKGSSTSSASPAKVDTIFDVLADHGPKLILCRHEQNAAFMAGMYGLLSGTPGVCLVTSGRSHESGDGPVDGHV